LEISIARTFGALQREQKVYTWINLFVHHTPDQSMEKRASHRKDLEEGSFLKDSDSSGRAVFHALNKTAN